MPENALLQFALARVEKTLMDQADYRSSGPEIRQWPHKVALGLTLFNGGLGLGLWALLWDRLGGSERLTALLSVSAQFLFIIALIQGTAVPSTTHALPVAWGTAGLFLGSVLLFFLAFAGQVESLFFWHILLAAGGMLGFLIYLFLLNRFLQVFRGGDSLMLHWWLAVGCLGLALAVAVVVPGIPEWSDEIPLLTGIPGVIATGVLSSLILRSRQGVLRAEGWQDSDKEGP